MGNTGFGGKSSQIAIKDPTFITLSFKKNRFYLYTRRDPPYEKSASGAETVSSKRDIINERLG